ncbi:YDG domain-containing protein [Caulobacter mirabilis]|uniref:Filamentous haemagglutinin FhaB/tRNA nuclease CdiA-like TPS domain-containing protein n=1 Tax=Caulobacter mirabilis TaxID=69666 RepID=A0A2D2B1F9_9CAUL|nr:YDG domain-containing protein [Caulobacter mirabilis]ATQ44047.1 hypothetical protein CSW64_17455 [Caulobacter mirabilis]
MTPSSAIFSIALRQASARRTRLLAASALSGVAAMLAQPSHAGTLPGIPGAGNITVSPGGSQPLISFPDAITLQVDLNAPRTVINWSSLHVSSGDTIDFLFDAASDIVLNKTTSQIRIDNGGAITGKVGVATGGNIWFYSPQGVIVSPGATMSAGGFVFAGGTGLNDTTFVNAADPTAVLRAASSGLIRMTTVSTATSASINAAGDVVLSASSGALSVQTAYGATTSISTTSGSITASEVTATAGAATVTAGGPGATVTQITGATGVTVSSNNNSSVGLATTTTSGDILITSNGSASLTLGNSARDITLSAPQVFVSTLDAVRSVYVTGTTQAYVTNRIFAGDDIEITADGNVVAGGAYLKSTGLGAVGDAHILLRSTNGSVAANNTLLTQGTGAAAGDIVIEAATTASLGTAASTRDIKVTGPGGASLSNGAAARDILVTATGGTASVATANAGRNLTWTASDDLSLTGSYSAAGTATLISSSGALNQTAGAVTAGRLDATSATGVTLGAANRIDVVANLQGGLGDVVLNNAKALSITGDVSGRDVTIVTTADALSVGSLAQIQATSDLVLTGATGFTSTTGAGGLVSGADSVTVTATTGDASVASVTSGGPVLVQALAGGAALRQATLAGGGALSVTATGAATLGADSLAGISAGNTVSRTGGFGTIDVVSSGGDARVFLAGLDGGLTSVVANTATGTASIGVDSGFTVGTVGGHNVGLYADSGVVDAGAITVGGGDYTARAADWAGVALNPGGTIRNLSITDTAGGLVLTHALTATGNLTLEANDPLTSAFALIAGGDVEVTAAGDVDLASAAAGDDITIRSTGGRAVLRSADLTGAGAGRDLSIIAAGDAVLGDPDYSAITAANVFSRSGGGAGSARIKSAGGAAIAHLDASEAIDLLEGTSVDVTIVNGPGRFGTLTALSGDIYAEVLNGALTVGTVTASVGDVGLYDSGGDLTITGSVHGGGRVHIETDGLLDGTLASLVSSGGDLELFGKAVDLGRITAGGALDVVALDGSAMVRLAQAGQTVQVISLTGDATLRAAEAPDGIAVVADGKATFGADDKASITAANYAVNDASCACGPGPGGLQVISFNGDAVVNVDTTSNGIAVLGASIGGAATAVQKTGDLKIDELAGHNIAVEVMGGALETGSTVSSGGDYTITAQDFRGDALTPTLFFGGIGDVTITDTLGDLDLGASVIHAGRKLTIIAQDGAVVGLAQLDAGTGIGDGEISVTGQGVSLDAVTSDGKVSLDGGTGLVNVATRVTVAGDYSLAGGGFSAAALTPLGAKAGTWTLTDKVGDFDFTGTPLRYGGDILLTVIAGAAIGGDIASDTGDIRVAAQAGRLGALDAANGQVVATAATGGMTVASARASDLIQISAAAGGAGLGAAILEGVGTNSLRVQSSNGDVVLGAGTPGAITPANVIASAGAVTTVEARSSTGKVDINLDRTNVALTTVEGQGAVKVAVANGALTIGQLTAGAASQVHGGGDVRLVSAAVAGDLSVRSATGNLRFGDATPGRVIAVGGALSLEAAADIAQQGVLRADSLSVAAGTGVVLLGANRVNHLDAVTVGGGGFAFNDTVGFDIRGPITAAGQTVDLRSAGAIGQAAAGIVTSQRLTGSSVGGAGFGAPNQVVQLGDFTNTGGLFKLVNGRALAIDGTVRSTGSVALTSHGGMSFTTLGTVTADGAGDAVILASDGMFANGRGADAVAATNAGGRWLIYTQAVGSPTGSTAGNSFNGLAGKSFYGSAYDFGTETFALTPNAGNRFVYAYRPTLTVTPNSLVVTYNGGIPAVSATITGLVNGDAAADAWSGAPTVSGATSKNVGTYVLTAAAGSLASDLNYAFAYGTGTLRIDAKTITGLLDANDKTYDRTTVATGSIGLTGVVAGDDVSAAGTYAFADRNAGAGKTVTASGVTLSGADAGNYILSPVAAAQADIFKKVVTGVLTASNKIYDGSTTATGSIGLTGVIAGDVVSASGAYAFADRNAGAGKVVTVSGAALSGLDAGNYDLGPVAAALADILRRQVTVTADDRFKMFGEVDPALTYRVTVGSLVAGDAFSGGLVRGVGETPGDYGITRGTLGLSANYEVTFVGAVFTIDPLPMKEQDGSAILRSLIQSPDFTLDWDPEPHLKTQGTICPDEGCAPLAALVQHGVGQ